MKRLLIVEDKESLALMLRETVATEGLEADIAANGGDAINRLASGRRYFAVLTDLRLPGADRRGLERHPARGADRLDRAAAGRVGHGQRALRAGHPPALAAARPGLRGHQLRGHSRHADRERAVRAREGRVHRRDGAAAR